MAATAILGLAGWLRSVRLKYLDRRHVRNLVREAIPRVLDSKDAFNEGMGVTLSADVLRAAQYNLMVKQLKVALESETPNLTHVERKEIYDALDWYHTKSLNAIKNKQGQAQFIDLPPGVWATTEMRAEFAEEKVRRLSRIKWLKLDFENIKDGVY